MKKNSKDLKDSRIEFRISTVLKKEALKKKINITEICREAIARAVETK